MKSEGCPPVVGVKPAKRARHEPVHPVARSTTLESVDPDANTSIAVGGPGRCGLFQCRKLDCNLKSHRSFVAARQRAWRQRGQLDRKGHVATSSRHASLDQVLDHAVRRVDRQIKVDFPYFASKPESSSVFRELSHHYFAVQIDRLISLFSPHLDRRTYKSTMIEHAMSNDIFCLCITANAKTDMLMRARTRASDRASELVYAVTANGLRQKLDNFKRTDTDWLLALVIALIGIDLAFARTANLRGHHQALRQLVTMKGGIHAIGHIVPYVTNTDRMLAVFTGEYPAFKESPVLPQLPVRKQEMCPHGAAFRRLHVTRRFDDDVLQVCLDLCHAIHLLETCGISMSSFDTPTANPALIPYYLYVRDRVNFRATCLHADYHENQIQGPGEVNDQTGIAANDVMQSPHRAKSRCVLLAAMIVEHYILNDNYYTTKGPYLGSQLKSVLQKQAPTEWSLRADTLIWILFVLAAVNIDWEHHEWVVATLKQKIEHRFRGRVPRNDWSNAILLILKEHLWPEMLMPLYGKTYKEAVVFKKQSLTKA